VLAVSAGVSSLVSALAHPFDMRAVQALLKKKHAAFVAAGFGGWHPSSAAGFSRQILVDIVALTGIRPTSAGREGEPNPIISLVTCI